MRASPHSQRLAHPGGPKRRDELGRGRDAAIALLGERHPLVAALGRLETIGAQLVVVAAMHALGLLLWWMKGPAGATVAVGALGLEIVLGCRLLVLLARRRDACLDLIAEGRESLPLVAVARERRRLSGPRHREHLARAIERLGRVEQIGGRQHTAGPPVDSQVVGPLRPQLDGLARQLRRENVSVRGVALAELLISSPTFALYGAEPDRLQREIGRVRYLLLS